VPDVEARLSALPAIRPLRDSRDLAGLEFADGLGAFCGYSHRSAEIVRETLGKSLRVPGGEVFVATWGRTIGAYLLLVPAGPDQPWGRLNDPRIQEIGVEVARDCRARGVAQALFRHAFGRPQVESRIYVATGYVWCWDLDRSGLAAMRYAERLLGLFERFGFRREWTNEPNVMMEPANFLAVRIGNHVSADLLRRFRLSERGERAA
jgi:ribosomal protein S18 acetylase RimI-like enzyme